MSKVDVVSMIYLKISSINQIAAKGEDAHLRAIPHSYYSSILSRTYIHTYIYIWMMQSYCLRNETFIHSLSLSPPWNEFQNLYLKLDIANTWCRWMDEICEGNRWNEMGLSHKMICFPFSLTSYHQVKWWYTWPFQLIVT